MKKNEFGARLNSIFRAVAKEMNGVQLECVNTWPGHTFDNIFHYAATSEKCMEMNLAEISGRERKTTFMSDLSIGEWAGGWRGVFETTENAVRSWRDNVEFMAEFVLCVNWKSWEHHGRGNVNWSRFYALLFEGVRDLMYDYYEGDDEKTSYFWEYLD